MPAATRVTPVQFLRTELAKAGKVAEAIITDEQLARANTLANRVRWLLKETMGADGEFERRAKEVELLQRRQRLDDGVEAQPADEAVAASFVESVGEGGFMRELLHAGELAVLIIA